MPLDKWIALGFLLLSLIYGYAAYTYQLLPFERHMSFLPNTLPMVLSVLGIILALIILIFPSPQNAEQGNKLGKISIENLHEYKIGQALAMITAMIFYAVALRPIGFLTATVLFLVGTSLILGERKLHVMLPVALIGAGGIWYLVQQVLGIFLRPLPWFMS